MLLQPGDRVKAQVNRKNLRLSRRRMIQADWASRFGCVGSHDLRPLFLNCVMKAAAQGARAAGRYVAPGLALEIERQ
jgi:hypothetical protein